MSLNSVRRLLEPVGALLATTAQASSDPYARRQLRAAVDVVALVAACADWNDATRGEEAADAAELAAAFAGGDLGPGEQPRSGRDLTAELEWLAAQPDDQATAIRTEVLALLRAQTARRSRRIEIGMYSA